MAKQNTPIQLHDPWLVVAGPGMGGVATLAVRQLIESLGAVPRGGFAGPALMGVPQVEVSAGVARPVAPPRALVWTWQDPERRHDLLIVLAEAAPPPHGISVLTQRIMSLASRHRVERLVTFGAVGTPLHPASAPAVLGTVTDPALMDPLRDLDIDLVREGRLGGLTGALLSTAATRGLPALCLLGEVPYYAAGLSNPRAAAAVLDALGAMHGATFDTLQLEEQAEAMLPQLLELHDQIAQQAEGDGVFDEHEPDDDGFDYDESDDDAPILSDEAAEHIERLFADAKRDRSRADALKAELDRLGVFTLYEGRFLDLFRRGA